MKSNCVIVFYLCIWSASPEFSTFPLDFDVFLQPFSAEDDQPLTDALFEKYNYVSLWTIWALSTIQQYT